MYLRGSKWSMARKPRRRASPFLALILVALIAAVSYFGAFVAPAIPAPFIPTPTVTRSAESYVNEAEQLYNEGKLTQAISAYQQAILADPNNPNNYLNLARIQIFAGEYEDAVTNAQNALLKNPNNPMAYAIQAWALNFQEDYLAAEAAVKRAIELDPNNALARAFHAEILINKGNYEDFEEAAAESRLAKELDPNALEVRRARGLVLLNSGAENLDEAISELKAALAVNDKIADLHLNLGFAYRLKGENDLAVDELLAAYALSPKDPNIPTEITLAYANDGQFGKAAQYAEDAVKIEPTNPRLHGNLGIMYYRGAEMEKAVASLGLAVRGGVTADGVTVQGLPLDYGKPAEYYWFYGFALAKTNRCAEAVPVFRSLQVGVPDDPLSVENAAAGLELCLASLGTPQAEATPTAEN
ncbi:MAG: tetratricopeptide repeat protein [Chloroflexi bacterium]|nr:tetratricopeptide repeat protein [Chloroflexota bacterium]